MAQIASDLENDHTGRKPATHNGNKVGLFN